MKWVVLYLGVVCSIHRLTGGYSVDQNHSVPISKEYVHLFTHGFRNLCLFRCWWTPVFPNAGFCFCFWIKMMQPSLVRSNDSVKPLLSSSFEILYESLTCLHSSFLCSSDKSLGTHLAQTRLIQKSSVRILKTEDLLTSLIDATSLNVRRLSFMTMSWMRDFVISSQSKGLPLLSASFKSQTPSENRLCHL